MLQNAYSLEKISADIAENERHFAENFPEIGNEHQRQLRELLQEEGPAEATEEAEAEAGAAAAEEGAEAGAAEEEDGAAEDAGRR